MRACNWALAALALAACGDDTHSLRNDAGIDAPSDGEVVPPSPPAIGAQLDRMGRPGIADALIAAFASSGGNPGMQKDTYDKASDPTMWRTTPLRTNVTVNDELKANLAVWDAIDNGLSTGTQTLAGCGNALLYAGPPGAQSYNGAAALFGDDEILIDSARTSCTYYLALELEYATGATFIHDNCGGRTLQYDAYNVELSVLAAGELGLDRTNQFAPRIRGTLAPHTDLKTSFPFLGEPH